MPDGLYTGLRIADVRAYDVRYGSLETAELAVPQPSYTSISFASMGDFYGPRWDRGYRVVSAVSRDVVSACGMDDPRAMFLAFSSDKVPSPPVFPGIIYREQLTRDRVLGEERQTDTVAAVKRNCRPQCEDPEVMAAQMGPHYPRLRAYVCDRLTGQVKPYRYVRHDEDQSSGWWPRSKQ